MFLNIVASRILEQNYSFLIEFQCNFSFLNKVLLNILTGPAGQNENCFKSRNPNRDPRVTFSSREVCERNGILPPLPATWDDLEY